MAKNTNSSSGSSGLELVVSEDRMSVRVKSYSPPGAQANLSLEDIYAELAILDVMLQPNESLLNNILLRSWSVSSIKDMTIMTGIMPRKKGASFFEPRSNLSLPVFKGTLSWAPATASRQMTRSSARYLLTRS